MDKALKYKADFTALTELVNFFDPCGLVSGGSPLDEYDSLTQQLLSAVYSKKTRQELKQLILHETEHHFGIPDLAALDKQGISQFYNGLNKLLDEIEAKFYTQ
jgi:hypothetical protein